MLTKICKKCKHVQNIEEFTINKTGTNYRKSQCNTCRRKEKKIYYLKNKSKCIVSSTSYNKKYKIKIQQYLKLWTKKRYKENITFRLTNNLRSRLKMALKGRGDKSKSTMELLGCSIEELKTYLESKFKQGMNWENHSFYGWHIDHIKPCASFDLSKSQQQKICFHYMNLQPLWAKDNLSKHTTIE